MYEYNLTSEMEFEQIRLSNEQLLKQNNELRESLETLLNYNNRLLSIIDDINNSKPQQTQYSPNNDYERQQYEQEIMMLRQKLDMMEQFNNQMQNELQQAKSREQHLMALKAKEKNELEINKLVQDVLRNNEVVQRKFEERILKMSKDIQELRESSRAFAQQLMQTFEEKQSTIDQLYEHFDKKDEIVELMTEKVRIIHEFYLNRSQSPDQQPQHSSVPRFDQNTQTESVKRASIQSRSTDDRANIEEKNKIIKVYEDLVTKLKKKVMEKAFA